MTLTDSHEMASESLCMLIWSLQNTKSGRRSLTEVALEFGKGRATNRARLEAFDELCEHSVRALQWTNGIKLALRRKS